jgi:hypothetical protein
VARGTLRNLKTAGKAIEAVGTVMDLRRDPYPDLEEKIGIFGPVRTEGGRADFATDAFVVDPAAPSCQLWQREARGLLIRKALFLFLPHSECYQDKGQLACRCRTFGTDHLTGVLTA